MLIHLHIPGHPDQSVAPGLLWADMISQFTGSSMEGTFPSIPDWPFRGHPEKAGDLESNPQALLQNQIAFSGLISFYGGWLLFHLNLAALLPWASQRHRAEA